MYGAAGTKAAAPASFMKRRRVCVMAILRSGSVSYLFEQSPALRYSAATSLHLDVRRAHHFSPFLDLGPDVAAEFVGREKHRRGGERRQPVDHRRVPHPALISRLSRVMISG